MMHAATVTIEATIRDMVALRLIIFRTYGSRIPVNFMGLYSLSPMKARTGSVLYWYEERK